MSAQDHTKGRFVPEQKPDARLGHMVSRSYISAWGDKRGRLDVIDIEEGRGYQTTATRATRVSYVYEAGLLDQANLEGQFGKIETEGIRAVAKLRAGTALERNEQHSVIAFLDMHLERGTYADQAKIQTPALAVRTDGTSEEVGLRLADRLILSRHMKEADRLADHGLENWQWAVYEGGGLVTGDGAVLRWAESKQNNALCTVTFPLSPTHLLVIGRPLDERVPINEVLVSRCRRWIIGQVGTLTKDSAVIAGVANGANE